MDDQMNQNGNGQRGSNQGGSGNQSPRKVNFFLLLLAALCTLILTSVFMKTVSGSTTEEKSYSEFMEWVDEGTKEGEANTKVKCVRYASDRIYIELVDEKETNRNPLFSYYGMGQKTTYYTAMVSDDTLPERLREAGVEVWGYIPDNSGLIMEILLYYVVPLILFWVLLSFLFKKMSKGGGPLSVGKSNAKVYVQKETGITFKDVAGEAGVPFFSLAGSDFIELYVGVGASRVRDLFKEATKNAPCIIFIDEIDAIGRSRDSKYGGNEEREQTLNQLLSEMDGFDTSKGILILGATNRPEILDKALLRPGRFDRRVIVDKPDLKGRVDILKVHAKDVKMDETVDFDAIALATSGAVGADLANMINEAAINAVKNGREYVSQKDLFDAVEQVLVGKEKKDRIMSREERKIVSYHEVGHALISALQKNSEPVQKITIVPRTMGALGYVMHVPEEEKYLNSEEELRNMLVSLVGGRAAEEVVFHSVTTGAANDIEKATNIARAMVTQYGMSKHFGLVGLSTVESKYLEGRDVMNCSDQTAAEVDKEVVAILKESYEQAKQMLSENRELMDKLAAFLIEKETITGKEFMEIFRREKGLPEPEDKKKDTDSGDDTKKDDKPAEASGMEDVKKPEEPKWTVPEIKLPEEEPKPEEPENKGIFSNMDL